MTADDMTAAARDAEIARLHERLEDNRVWQINPADPDGPLIRVEVEPGSIPLPIPGEHQPPLMAGSARILAAREARMATEATIKKGFRLQWAFPGDTGEIVVMGVVDRYVMVRRPGAMPFVLSVKEVTEAINGPAPDRIARRLSEIKKSVLLVTGDGWRHYTGNAPRTVARNELVEAGLIDRTNLSGMPAYRLTPLGRAVADAIRAEWGEGNA